MEHQGGLIEQPATALASFERRSARLGGLTSTLVAAALSAATLGGIAKQQPANIVLACACALAAMLALHTRHVLLAIKGMPHAHRWFTLGAQAMLTYAPFVAVGAAWSAIPGLFAGAVLLTLPLSRSLPLLGLIVVAEPVLSATVRDESVLRIPAVVATPATALVLFGLVRLAGLGREVHSAHAKTVHYAILGERQRFSRDLHDLLGHRLSVVALKTELAHRLAADTPRAQEEIQQILEIVRQTLSDVRAVAYGYRRTSLEDELSSARSTLEAAGVRCRVMVSCSDLTPEVVDVLVSVLHESVTNILRHAEATMCHISLHERSDRLRMTVSNDGVLDAPAHSWTPGSGVRNLRERLAAVDGYLTAGRLGDGAYRLSAHIPWLQEKPKLNRQ